MPRPFSNGESFRLIYDPLSTYLGTQGWLKIAGPSAHPYLAEYGFSFSFLDEAGTPILSESTARVVRSGGDLHGDVTMLQGTTIYVSGLLIEFSGITNSGFGGLPVEYDGARFLIHNALFGPPFATAQSIPEPIPEPTTLSLFTVGTIGFLLFRYWGMPSNPTLQGSRKKLRAPELAG